jgi:hypothetical protein
MVTVPSTAADNVIVQESTVGTLSLPNVKRVYSLIVLDAGIRALRMDSLESLTSGVHLASPKLCGRVSCVGAVIMFGMPVEPVEKTESTADWCSHRHQLPRQ